MKQITKKEISKTAISLIRKNGYANVTIQDICDACQITKPTFYKYAGSKEDLILDLYDHTIGDIVSDPCRFIGADSYFEQLLYVFVILIRETLSFGSDMFSQMLIANLQENHNSFDMREQLTRMCLLIISKAQKNGEIRNPNPPEKLYNAIAHMFTGYEVMWCIHNGTTHATSDFFETLNAVLDVREDLRDFYITMLERENLSDLI